MDSGPRSSSSPAARADASTEFDEALKAAKPLLRALALRLTKSPADADDLVQDVLERALLKARDLPATKLRPWLVAVQSNLFIDQCRQKARRPRADIEDLQSLPAPEPIEPPAVWESLDVAALREASSRLPDEFRRAYELHAFEAKSYREISAELGVPSKTVGTRLLRARKRLRVLLMDALEKGKQS